MKTRKFFVLSGECPELARDEIASISKSYDAGAKFESDQRLLIVNSSSSLEKIATRATFVRTAGHVAGEFDSISDADFGIPRPETFACRTVNLSQKYLDSRGLESEAGRQFAKKWGSKVSLSNPALVLYLIITDSGKYLGYSSADKAPARPSKPFKYPHELPWKLARSMVNLSGLREGQTLCDPFCGTGTILLEGESMGIRSLGIDLDMRMCRISGKNLARNSYKPMVINSAFGYVKGIEKRIDAVVTDLPYGTSSRSSAPPRRLLQDFLSVVPKKMRLVMVYKKGLGIEDLEWSKKYEIFRHKSLTRVIVVR